jgi:hypothetical protein
LLYIIDDDLVVVELRWGEALLIVQEGKRRESRWDVR